MTYAQGGIIIITLRSSIWLKFYSHWTSRCASYMVATYWADFKCTGEHQETILSMKFMHADMEFYWNSFKSIFLFSVMFDFWYLNLPDLVNCVKPHDLVLNSVWVINVPHWTTMNCGWGADLHYPFALYIVWVCKIFQPLLKTLGQKRKISSQFRVLLGGLIHISSCE